MADLSLVRYPETVGVQHQSIQGGIQEVHHLHQSQYLTRKNGWKWIQYFEAHGLNCKLELSQCHSPKAVFILSASGFNVG